MIRGVYLNTMNDDLSECRKIYHQVFGKTNNDDMNAEQWRENDNIAGQWPSICCYIMRMRCL